MTENSKKFETYQQTIETMKLEITTLEAEIENMKFSEQRYQKVSTEIADDRQRTLKQLETLRNLNGVLNDQLKNLQ